MSDGLNRLIAKAVSIGIRGKEIKKYDALKAEAKANLSLFKNKNDVTEKRFSLKNKALDRVKKLRQDIHSKKNKNFKNKKDA